MPKIDWELRYEKIKTDRRENEEKRIAEEKQREAIIRQEFAKEFFTLVGISGLITSIVVGACSIGFKPLSSPVMKDFDNNNKTAITVNDSLSMKETGNKLPHRGKQYNAVNPH